MKRLTIALLCAVSFIKAAAAQDRPIILSDKSFKNEVQRAIDRGLDWLKADQNTNGWWSTPDHPALTALPIMAFKSDPSKRLHEAEFLKKGYAHVLKSAKPNGAIYTTNLPTYNTSLAMLALVAANDPAYEPVLRKARAFLVGLQTDFGEKGKADDVFDGGIGYGTKYEHSDMGNTLQALEALYHTRHLADDSSVGAKDLNWAAAIHFLQNCQNLSSHNKQQWVSNDPKDKGGFVYYPGHSMAGGETNSATGRIALRSYGSISYGGMLSYIYADLKRDDPRVSAVHDWLRRNYTLEENPGMGPQGLYYYFHTQAKALTTLGVNEFELADGRKVNWRRQLASRLMDLQKRDGSWANDNSRWWEKDPVLVTSYAVLTLSMVQRGL